MGADEFYVKQSAKTADAAFSILVEKAQHEDGHGGYTGTIAEKSDFRMVEPLAGETPRACAQRCADDDRHWSGDKWGPAACIDTGPDPKKPGNRVFVFFGVASS